MTAQTDVLRVFRWAQVAHEVPLAAALELHVGLQVALHLVRSPALRAHERRRRRRHRVLRLPKPVRESCKRERDNVRVFLHAWDQAGTTGVTAKSNSCPRGGRTGKTSRSTLRGKINCMHDPAFGFYFFVSHTRTLPYVPSAFGSTLCTLRQYVLQYQKIIMKRTRNLVEILSERERTSRISREADICEKSHFPSSCI